MSSYRPRGGYPPSQQTYRSYASQNRDNFYDDRRSSSRSPDRRPSSPHRRRSPPHDSFRPPHGPAQDGSHSRHYNDRSRDYDDARSSPPPRRGREYYDRDKPRADTDRRGRSASRSRSSDERPPSRGNPSKEIIMEGLAPHLTENEITSELRKHYHADGLDDVRVIRDRQTKQSRQFGFLRFSSLEEAETFMDRNYPVIYLYGDSSKPGGETDSAKVRISYSRERKEPVRSDEGDWICSVCNINNFSTRVRCFRCQTIKPEPAAVGKAANIGDNDASPDNTPSQFLLIRGLEPSVSEELFAKGVAKLNKPSGTTTQQAQTFPKKGAKMASTTGDSNLGAKEGTLRRVLLVRDRRSNESWRYGFAEYASIEDAQAALTRYNSFDRFTIASKHVLVSYIHAGVFVPVVDSTSGTDRFTFSPLTNPALKLAYWDEDAYAAELVISLPDAQRVDDRSTQATAGDSEGLKMAKEAEKAKKRKAQTDPNAATAKKAAPSHLQFWSNRHAELHGIKHKASSENGSEASDDKHVAPSKSFGDPKRKCCYLCMRQFNDAAEVNRHERLSELHRRNLKSEVKVQKADSKLEKHGVQQQAAPAGDYRDRARERRKIYGVVNKKGEQVGAGPKKQQPDEDESAPAQSKGASLLSKMGYTAGQGLGVSGEGMTAPINQDIYVAGVGLGAEGGKVGDAVAEAEKKTKGDYNAFAESVRQGARDRYARM